MSRRCAKFAGLSPCKLKGVGLTFVLGCLTLLTWFMSVRVGAQTDIIHTQDVIIVIDNSGSMDNEKWARQAGKTLSDPEGRRFDAAKLVISYLAVNTIEGQRHYRVGVISFGKDAILLPPLERVWPGSVAERLRQDVDQERDLERRKVDYSFTNPHVALEAALREMEAKGSFKQTEPPAVILITDGRFTENSFGKDREEYIRIVEEAVRSLAEKKAKLYVVLIGEAREDETEWRRLTDLARGMTFSLSDPNALIEVYHDLIRNLVGIEAFGVMTGGPIQAKAKGMQIRSFTLKQEDYPYLDALILVVFQTQPDIDVTFIQPDGQKLVPVPERVEREGEQYVITWRILRPQYGKWRVELRGGSKDGQVQYWADVRHLLLHVQKPNPHKPLAPGQPVLIEVKLVNGKGIVKERPEFPLLIDLTITRPDGHQTIDHMSKQDDSYVFVLKDTDQRGEYKLKFKVKVKKEEAESLLHEKEWSFRIAAVPSISQVLTEPRINQPVQVKEPLQLEVYIENATEQERLQVFAQILDHQGLRMGGPIRLTPSKELPNAYLGELSFEKTGQYTVTVYLAGRSKEAITYGPDQDLQIERSFLVQVITEIPQLKGVYFEPSQEAVPTRQNVLIYARIDKANEARDFKVSAQIQGIEGEWPLRDDGVKPDDTAGDGLFTGYIPGFGNTGLYTVTLTMQGRDITGTPFTSSSRPYRIRVVLSLRDKAIRAGIIFAFLAMLTGGMYKCQERKRKAFPLGTLRVLRPSSWGGQQWFLDEFETKEVTLGIDAGLISLPATGEGVTGLYARFYGRREGGFPRLPWWLWWLWWAEWLYIHLSARERREEVVTYIEGLSQERPILLSGVQLAKGEKAQLFEGSTVEIGTYVLEYLAPQLEW